MKTNTPSEGKLPFVKDISPGALWVDEDFTLIDNFSVPDFMFEPFRTHYTIAVFVFEGEYDVSVNMRRYHVQAPCLLQLLSDETVQYHSTTLQPKAVCLVLSRRATKGLIPDRNDMIAFYQSVRENPVVPFAGDYQPTVNLFIASLREVLRHDDNPNRLGAVQNLTRAFFLSMPQLKKASHVPQSHRDELMFNFLQELRQHFRAERTIAFYADRLCLSSKHLSKVVKQASGRTVHDWIDEYVTTEAKALLRSTDMTVSQVADALGFASQPLFTKFFRRATGLNPSKVRRRE